MNSFSGHSNTTGLYLIKNINSGINGLTLYVTPIVLGSGSFAYNMHTPFLLREKC